MPSDVQSTHAYDNDASPLDPPWQADKRNEGGGRIPSARASRDNAHLTKPRNGSYLAGGGKGAESGKARQRAALHDSGGDEEGDGQEEEEEGDGDRLVASRVQRPKPPQTSDSFKKLLGRNLSAAQPVTTADLDFLSRPIDEASPTATRTGARPSPLLHSDLYEVIKADRQPGSAFSASSSEFAFSSRKAANRTSSVSSVGSGGTGRLKEVTSSFLRRLRGIPKDSSETKGRGENTPIAQQRGRSSYAEGLQRGSATVAAAQQQRAGPTTSSQLVASLIDRERSRGLYKESSDASVTSYQDTDESAEESLAPGPADQPSLSGLRGRESDCSLSSRSSRTGQGRTLKHKSSTDLPIIEGSPADEEELEYPGPLYRSRSGQAHTETFKAVRDWSGRPSIDSQRTPQASEHHYASTRADMPSAGDRPGGWRNRFGGSRRSEKGGGGIEGQTTATAAQLSQQRDLAAQHIARQQRSVRESGGGGGMAKFADIAPTHQTPHEQVVEYRHATRTASKAERMMGVATAGDQPLLSSSQMTSPTTSSTSRWNTTLEIDKDDAACPVCIEPLSFRLAGEKAHVLPQCGHALHHACFTAVYGAPELVLAAQAAGSANATPGMCGVCRKLIVLPDEGAGARTGKVKSMMGLGSAPGSGEKAEQHAGGGDGGRDGGAMHSTALRQSSKVEPVSDDPLDGDNTVDMLGTPSIASGYAALHRSRSSAGNENEEKRQERHIVLPTIKVRPEFDSVCRSKRPRLNGASSETQNVVCVVSVHVPPRRRRARSGEEDFLLRQRCEQYGLLTSKARQEAVPPPPTSIATAKHDDEVDAAGAQEEDLHENGALTNDNHFSHDQRVEGRQDDARSSTSEEKGGDDQDEEGDEEEEEEEEEEEDEEGFSYSATPAANSNKATFRDVIDDLRHRIIDWKGHSVDKFGELILFDFLGVRQDAVMRDFHVFLFREALLCVSEERKKERRLARLINSATPDNHTSSGSSHSRTGKAAMKLKGRIWMRHIRQCQELDVDGNPCLSIRLDDDALDHFVLCFKDHSLRKTWKSKLSRLLQHGRSWRRQTDEDQKVNGEGDVEETVSATAASRHTAVMELCSTKVAGSKDGSFGSLTTSSSIKKLGTSPSVDSKLAFGLSTHSSPVTLSNHTSPASMTRRQGGRGSGQDPAMPAFLSNLPQHQQWSASGGLDPGAAVPNMLPHIPLDLIIMVSVPSVTAQPAVSSSTISSSAALKLRLIRSTLEFVIAYMGIRDRIALVAYNVGVGGAIRRTALLNASKTASRQRLESFIESIGIPWTGPEQDPFQESFDDIGGHGERTDTVTAVNVGFDIVLQRKSKNPTASMLLINDTADAPKRGQMDLIMARGEAANVPVHCFGFGKSHDPSSLWLISNHTRGSYTFVKEWYQLRECVAGCLGALMSIALTDVKIHVSVPSDNHFRVRKVTGCTGTIVSSSGKDVDLTIGELRFGETKELLLELELDFGALVAEREERRDRDLSSGHYERGSATDDFMQRLGLQGLSIAEARRPINAKRIFNDGSTNGSETETFGAEQMDGHGHYSAGHVDDAAVLEVHCGSRDPQAGITKRQLSDPCVLTIEVDSTPVSRSAAADEEEQSAAMTTALADPTVTRRRLEILVSDMITRSLLLVSRGSNAQALQILLETRKIVDTVLRAIPAHAFDEEGGGNDGSAKMTVAGHRNSTISQSQAALYATQTRNSHARKQRNLCHRRTAMSLIAIMEDLDVLIDGLEMNKAVSFERSERNFGAQQAMALRDQKAWTSRTDTEWSFFSVLDNGPAFAALAAHFAANVNV